MREHLPLQIAVGGLAYLGLSLATAFSTVMPTIGFNRGGRLWTV